MFRLICFYLEFTELITYCDFVEIINKSMSSVGFCDLH